MGKLTCLLPLLALLPFIKASYEPPAEVAIADVLMANFSAWYDYAGPTGTAAVQAQVAESAIASAAKTKTKTKTTTTATPTPTSSCTYWMENIKHQGIAAFNTNSSYGVFRNVKDYGAKGDGVTDDTLNIQRAISDGNRLSSGSGLSGTNTPAVVYFPAGTYLISCSIIDYYNTQIIGNPNCMPTLKSTPMFNLNSTCNGRSGLIDGDVTYATNPNNIFYRQVRNLILDTTAVPAGSAMTAIHWPTAQATSLQNVVMNLADGPGTQHIGFLAQSGSAGWLSDIVIKGGVYGMNMGNQQWTMRNISISNSVYCISLGYDWGWTFAGLNLNNCTTVAIDMTSGGYANIPDQNVHAVVLIDSTISNTPVAVNTAHNTNLNANNPPAGGQLILENVKFVNVQNGVYGLYGINTLAGGTRTVTSYIQGHVYNSSGSFNVIQESASAPLRPVALLGGAGGGYYTQSKPQYETLPASSFLSVRTMGAVGDGVTDDTKAIQKAVNQAAKMSQVCYFDAGTYLVTSTVKIPAGSRIVGEGYAVIMSGGSFFDKVKKPQPVVQIGAVGGTGTVYWSDMIVSTSSDGTGGQSGAILIEYNLESSATAPSGLWDVHARIGGFIGSKFQGNTCPANPSKAIKSITDIPAYCYAAFLSLHVTPKATGLYLENTWFWTADHDIDANYGGNQVTLYTGRGALIESLNGPTWLWGTSVEHHTLYQYSFVNTQNVFAGQIQTETAYWQPNPPASVPFAVNPTYYDPVFPTAPFTDRGMAVPNAEGFGARILDSTVHLYGAGFYSFFNNYTTTCSNQNVTTCQSRILDIQNSTVYLYDLHTVGSVEMVTRNGKDVVYWGDNQADFTSNVGFYSTTP